MRQIYGALIFLALVTGCGDKKDASAPPPPPSPVASLKSDTGFMPLVRSDVSVIVIHLEQNSFDGSGPVRDKTRSFYGDDVAKVTRSLGLEHPQEIGAPAAIPTGQVTITYKMPNGKYALRKLTIMNDRVLMDQSYKGVTYVTHEPLTEKWLEELTK
jgi:hypothetical protein